MKISYQYSKPKPLVISFQCCYWTYHFVSCIQTIGNHPERGIDLAASWRSRIPGNLKALNSWYDVFTEETGWRRHLSLYKTVFHCIVKRASDLTHHLLILRCSVQQLTLALAEQGVFTLLNSLEIPVAGTPQNFKRLTNYYKNCELNWLVLYLQLEIALDPHQDSVTFLCIHYHFGRI